MTAVHEDFSDLYRNALSERDPQHKALLLRRVTEALDEWKKRSRSVGEQRARECETMPRIPARGMNERPG